MVDMSTDKETDSGWRQAMYVPHDQISIYLLNGWRLVDDFQDTHHGRYAVLMEKK